MTGLTLINITNSTSNGMVKSFTELCTGCDLYRRINSESRCYWGIAYKVLDKTKILSYCQLMNRPSPRKEKLEARTKFLKEIERNSKK